MVILAYDGDNAGRLVGRAILGNDPETLSDVSSRIELGHEIVRDWAESHGGVIISGGGDEGCFQVPEEALEDLERLRTDYNFATNLTITVGVGVTLSEAGKSLIVGKFRGKNIVIRYDDTVEKDLAQAQQNVAMDRASPEERKLSESYLKPQDGDEVPKDEEEASYRNQGLTPPGMPKPQNEDQDAPGLGNSMDQTPKQSEQNPDVPPAETAPQAAPAEFHTKEGMSSIVDAIFEEEGGQKEEKPMAIDAADKGIGTENEGNVSRPTGYKDQNSPNDMGLAEDSPEAQPDITGVLKDGLDQHADNMQREKVIDMIGQALQGFKANKHILERAQQKAPELYMSCLSMLKAMIEMSKMLGLGQAQQNPLEDPAAQEEIVDQNEMAAPGAEEPCPYCEPKADDCPYCKPAAEESLHDCPYCADCEDHEKHKDKPLPEKKEAKPEDKKAAPKEGAAPAPKEKG